MSSPHSTIFISVSKLKASGVPPVSGCVILTSFRYCFLIVSSVTIPTFVSLAKPESSNLVGLNRHQSLALQ